MAGLTTRRRFLGEAVIAGAALHSARPALAARRRRRPTVAVLGGGVAGLTAAQELAERGFRVTVFERKAFGGKARSIPVPGSARGGRPPLPGEHGFRIEFGFYRNLPDTMRRIPAGEGTVHDRLRPAGDFLFARDGGREALYTGLTGPIEPLDIETVRREVVAAAEYAAQLERPDEPAFLARQIAMFLTSSPERRFGQWEHVSWWDYLRAADMSEEYQKCFARGITEIPAALKCERASTRTAGGYVEACLMANLGREADGRPMRLFDRPTNEAWIDPWLILLRGLGVGLRVGHSVDALRLRRGRIAAARVTDRRGRRGWFEADHFVCALPMARARALLGGQMRRADPRLESLDELDDAWLTGVQYYLRERLPISHGHVLYIDSPWDIASVSQAQFWSRDFGAYGDGSVRDCLSATLGEWDTAGQVVKKAARACTPTEIAREVLAQIKAHIEPTRRAEIPDNLVHSWFLDDAIRFDHRRQIARNDDPYFQNVVGSWSHRPEHRTAIPNLVLAGDYVRCAIDVATMEGANETGRLAAAAILHETGSAADGIPVHQPYAPPEFEQLKRLDAQRFQDGLPHVLDMPWP